MTSPFMLKSGPPELPGLTATSVWMNGTNCSSGRLPNVFAALGYDAGKMLADAIKRAGSADPEKIQKALEETKDLKVGTGTITMDKNHNPIKQAVILQNKDGDRVMVAKIMPEEMEGIKHYLVDELDPKEEFHVARFQQMAKDALKEIYAKGKIPLIVGGTGFYIQSLLYDIDFTKEDGDQEYRKQLEEKAKTEGNDSLYEMLKQVDPKSTEKIHKNNVKRVIRALEFYKLNGYPISEHNEKEAAKTSPYNFAYFVLNHKRDILYDRINRRVDIMAEQGLIDEVKRLKEEGYEKTMVSMQGIGYRQVFEYLEGNLSLEDTIEQIKKDTRHFAKRQLTWFGREKEVCMVDKSQFGSEDEILTYMLTILKEKGIYDGSVKELL